MTYIVLYNDENGKSHKLSAKTKAQAYYLKRKILRGFAEANFFKAVENLKRGFDVEIKSEEDVEILLDDLARTYEEKNKVVIISENQWREFMDGKQVVRVPELGYSIITDASVDFSDPEEYENLLNFLQEREKV